MVKLLLVPLLLYLAVCVAAFAFQGRMLFPVPPARTLPPGAERLYLDTTDGVRLAGAHFAAAVQGPRAPLLLAFAGNGWNADDAADYLHDLYPAAEIVAFHYRGYPPSGGSPRSRDLQADALHVHDFAVRRSPGRVVVAVGFSIGSGVAAHLAAHRPLAGAILVTPFDSLTKVAAAQLPWLPVRLLFRNPMEAAADLRGTHVPVAILAGARDTLVRPARTDALRAAVPNLAYDRTIAGVGHNDIYSSPAFRQAMQEALATLLTRATGPAGK
jgi:pimeloyl-ACP methyl ester carboxylesterase